jgi:hypothetical protein
VDGIRALIILGLAAAFGAMVGGCSTPSERFGLAPQPADLAYPNINMDPTKQAAQKAMTPEERAAAEAELERRAGRKPKSAPAAAN